MTPRPQLFRAPGDDGAGHWALRSVLHILGADE